MREKIQRDENINQISVLEGGLGIGGKRGNLSQDIALLGKLPSNTMWENVHMLLSENMLSLRGLLPVRTSTAIRITSVCWRSNPPPKKH